MPQEKINDEMYKTPKKKSRLKTVMLLVGGVLLLLFIASAFIGGLFMADEFDALRDKTAAVISGDPVEEETG
ncbi:MAG: hypothetical protein QY318_00435 [Candidatus Dojkabacteria bacterium]|nr:MAG: hypothetical protein QY318_00435 [Candidatus Dojkabacteria bacterium]